MSYIGFIVLHRITPKSPGQLSNGIIQELAALFPWRGLAVAGESPFCQRRSFELVLSVVQVFFTRLNVRVAVAAFATCTACIIYVFVIHKFSS